jgi:hypothetical protein
VQTFAALNGSSKGDIVRKYLAPVVVAALAVAGCTSGDEGDASASPDPAEASRAPGVTDDTIKIGVTYPDLEAISEVTNIDHGDYQAVYQALIDDINERGGINGRQLEPVFAPINPTGTQPAEEACLRLTGDDQVFAVVGYIQGDNALCYLETHQTAVVGGEMTPERLERAQAPWFTTEPSADLQADVVRAMHEAGELEGELAVVAMPTEEALLRDSIEPVLDELGVEPVSVGPMEAPGDGSDIAAANAQAAILAERLRSQGVEKVLLVGAAIIPFANGLEQTDYRPQLLATGYNEILSWVNDAAGHDLSVVEDAVVGGVYGPGPDVWALPAMQDCMAVIEERTGEEIPEPPAGQTRQGAANPFVSAGTGCANMTLVEAMLDAAGEDLDYATFRQAGEELGEVEIPRSPDPYTYGPPPSADGDIPIYVYDFNPETRAFDRRD